MTDTETRAYSVARSDTYFGKTLPSIANENWREDANCNGLAARDSDPWFPDESNGPTLTALQVCKRCPVINECLQHALDNGEIHGVWGGLSANQRRQLRRQQVAA